MTDRDAKRLQGCVLPLIQKMDRVLTRMADEGNPMMVTDGIRTLSEQAALWAKGRTYADGRWRVTGRVVTYCDGVIHPSNHQSGRACDCTFLVNGSPSWDESLPWERYGEIAEDEGLLWGGRWKGKKRDKPHAELSRYEEGVLKV